MIFSADHRHALGLLVIRELGQSSVDGLLQSCLAAVEAGVAPAGLVLRNIDTGRQAGFEHGTSGPQVRTADAYLYEDSECIGCRRLIVTVRLVVDLGEPGDTAMKMLLQLAAQREDGPEFLLGRRMHAELNQHMAEDMRAQPLVATALARLIEISGSVDELCKQLSLDFCLKLADELTP